MIFCWVFNGLAFFFDRYRVPVMLPVLGWMFLVHFCAPGRPFLPQPAAPRLQPHGARCHGRAEAGRPGAAAADGHGGRERRRHPVGGLDHAGAHRARGSLPPGPPAGGRAVALWRIRAAAEFGLGRQRPAYSTSPPATMRRVTCRIVPRLEHLVALAKRSQPGRGQPRVGVFRSRATDLAPWSATSSRTALPSWNTPGRPVDAPTFRHARAVVRRRPAAGPGLR